MIKVSIIVPVYGVEKYIEKCARSILEQTYANLEILFVDDCSPDNSIVCLKQILADYPQRKNQVKILVQSKNNGVAAARRWGMLSVTGDYTIQFDSDDFVDPQMIEILVREAERTNADIVICDINQIKEGVCTHLKVNPPLNPIECMKQVLIGDIHASLCNKLIRRNLFIEYNILPIDGLNMREDLSIMYRLFFFANKIAYVAEPFYNYVVRSGSITSMRMSEDQQQDAQELILQMNEFCAEQGINDKSILDSFNYFKANIESEILLHGSISLMRRNLFKDVPLRFFFSHPHLTIYQKAMALAFATNSIRFTLCVRKFADFLKRIKSFL